MRRAALVISNSEIGRLDQPSDAMDQAAKALLFGADEPIDRTARYNNEFHGAIAHAAGETIARTVHDCTVEEQARSNYHHREILAAFPARSPDWAESVAEPRGRKR